MIVVVVVVMVMVMMMITMCTVIARSRSLLCLRDDAGSADLLA